MPTPIQVSDWLCIATSGPAIDERIIEPQWLIDAAETYSRSIYTAMVWPHHPQIELAEREFTCNMGEVDALKIEVDGDKTKLYAKIIPNQFLIDANRMGQKLFTSAEFVSDFAGSGREYLFGLAVTDIPASLGTEKITFNLAGEQKPAGRGNMETFSLGSLNKPAKKSFWARVFSAQSDNTPPPENEPAPGEDLKMDELKTLIQQLVELLSKAQQTTEAENPDAETPEVAAEEVAEIADEIAAAAEEVAVLADEVAANPEDEVKAEEFSAAKASLMTVMKRFTACKPAPRRSRRREFSARRRDKGSKGDNKGVNAELTALTNQLTTALTTLSATEFTQRPGAAPAGSKKPHEFT